MNQSVFLAQLLGPIFLVVGVSVFVNEKFFRKVIAEVKGQNFILYMSGLVSLLFGLYILITVGNSGYFFEKLIALFGFLALIKGVLLVIFPKVMKKLAKKFLFLSKFLQYFGFIYMVIGIYLCYVGYAAVT